jgi:hypothetical protein
MLNFRFVSMRLVVSVSGPLRIPIWVSSSARRCATSGSRAAAKQLPLGCIYDTLTPDIGIFEPLTIEVHCHRLPTSVLQCDYATTSSYFFRHSFKESLQITHGNQDLITHQTLHQKVETTVAEKNFVALCDGLK